MARRFYTCIIVPHSSHRLHKLRIPARALHVLTVIGVISFFVAVGLGFTCTRMAFRTSDYDQLQAENQELRQIIGELQGKGPRELLEFTRMTGAVVQGLRECPMPVVASVNGVAAGAGAIIALAADFRILARSATYAFLFTRVGLAGADMGSAYLLPRLVGLAAATELLMLGDTVDAERALALGLANRVVDDEQLDATTRELARRLADGPTLAYASTKMLLSRELDMSLGGALELEAATQALLMTSRDHAEFYEAFKGKRDPRWSGA